MALCLCTVDVYGPVFIHCGCIWPCVYALWMYMALCVYTVDVYGPVCIHCGCIWPCVYALWMYMALCVYIVDVYGPGQPYLANTLLMHLKNVYDCLVLELKCISP